MPKSALAVRARAFRSHELVIQSQTVFTHSVHVPRGLTDAELQWPEEATLLIFRGMEGASNFCLGGDLLQKKSFARTLSRESYVPMLSSRQEHACAEADISCT